MSEPAFAARFPARSFVSQAEFDAYCEEEQQHLDARYAWEQTLASPEPSIVRPGTCAPCLRAATFTARTQGGEVQPGGGWLPNWREELTCDCGDGLGSRPRALLHFLASVSGAQPWTRALLFGAPTPTDRRIAAMVGSVTAAERLTDAHLLPSVTGSQHLAVASDSLQRVPPLDAALAELRRVLAPGGQLAFTVPFRYRVAHTREMLDRAPRVAGRLPADVGFDCHEIGWDILPRLRKAGFARATAYCYWSRELGYLGPFNMIFGAVA